jgi:hypothetical protein
MIAIAMVLALLSMMASHTPASVQPPPEPPLEVPSHCTIAGLGWFYDEGSKHRVGFGLAAISTGTPYVQEREYGDVVIWPAKGILSMIDHKSKTMICGTFESIGSESPSYKHNNRIMEGKGIFKGEMFRIAVEVKDKGESDDWILIEII